MNKNNALLFIPLIKALAEGKTLQYRLTPQRPWSDLHGSEVGFSDPPENYRVKPEPVVSYMNLYPNDGNGRSRYYYGGFYHSKAEADAGARPDSRFVVKVTEEEGKLPVFEAILR